jgi:hypothetical protein
MLKILSVASIFLLFFTGITALISGGALLLDPSGKPLRMSTAILSGSPFNTFFVPGLILFLFIGVSCIAVAFFMIKDKPYSTKLVLAQGVIMILWIIVQLVIIKQFHLLQLLYLFIGIAFVYTGYLGFGKKEYLHT